MGFAAAARAARVRVHGLGLNPDRTQEARPSWQGSGAGLSAGAGTVIKLMTRLQKAVGGRWERLEGN